MNVPLLTIAIPTWNRAKLLDNALGVLFPQLEEFKEQIEIIISDNGSDDNTPEVINRFKNSYPTLNIIQYRHESNTGYFGNFSKCRELSTGKYLWLLSDNDFVSNNIVQHIFGHLSHNPAFVFLKDWSYNKKPSFLNYISEKQDVESVLKLYSFQTTLISAVIFKNKKKDDYKIYEQFKGNTFIGYLFFLKALEGESNAIVISGNSLFIKNTSVSFNVFKSFTVDLLECLKFAEQNSLFTQQQVDEFVNTTIKDLIVRKYITFRLFGEINGVNLENRKEVDNLLTKGFLNYDEFNNNLMPLIQANKRTFFHVLIKKHAAKFIKQQIIKLK